MVLQTESLAIGYRHPIADNLSLSLKAGELVCLIGPNGTGKTTLMRTLAGLQQALNGNITLAEKPLSQFKPRALAQTLSLVLTDRIHMGMLTGYELVALGRHPHTDWTGQLTEHDHQIVRWAVELLSAKELAPRKLTELSDGERQKLLIARALAQQPKLMLLDEPTAFLDLPRRVEVIQHLRDIAHSTGCSILLSTHDLDLALRSADRLWLMSNGQILAGAPEDLVLNGAFEQTFGGLPFDRRTGQFIIPQTNQRRITVIGVDAESEKVLWTKRALQRIGYEIDDAATNVVRVGGDWEFGGSHYQNLYHLLQAISFS